MVCLTVFATLSLLTANRDQVLVEGTLASVTDYYVADYEALKVYATIQEELNATGHGFSVNQVNRQLETVLAQSESGQDLYYTVPCGEQHQLVVWLHIDKAKSTVTRLNWCLQANEELVYESEEAEFGELIGGGL